MTTVSNEMWATIIHAGITLILIKLPIQCQDQENTEKTRPLVAGFAFPNKLRQIELEISP